MSSIDKNKAVIDFLMDCPQIRDNRLFFNFINGQNNDKQFVTVSNDRSIHRPYIDGSVLKRYTFTIIDFRSVSYQAIVPSQASKNENIEEMLDVQGIIDWITEKSENLEYPDFGVDCIIDSMRTSSDIPNLNGVDTSMRPALAKYSISIFIEYIDNSKKIWR